MSGALLIEGARIVDPASGLDAVGHLVVEDGRIAKVAAGGAAAAGGTPGADRIDAHGLVLAPGLIDMRVFTGEPGHEYRETLATASAAAAAGGVTSFVVMPDTLSRARALRLDSRAMLMNNDGYTFFEKIGDLVVTGPTKTNVNDFRAILIDCAARKFDG